VDLDDLSGIFVQYAWLYLFPGIGVLVGVVEFILSIVSYSIVCCCRPASVDQVSQLVSRSWLLWWN